MAVLVQRPHPTLYTFCYKYLRRLGMGIHTDFEMTILDFLDLLFLVIIIHFIQAFSRVVSVEEVEAGYIRSLVRNKLNSIV